MKPFFSIRIEWNPADSDEQSHRDCFSTKRSVARQVNPSIEWFANDEKRNGQLRDDTRSVVDAIARCIDDLKREAKWTLPDLTEDLVFELANNEILEEQLLRMATTAIDGCDDSFLDSLQELIDNERKNGGQP